MGTNISGTLHEDQSSTNIDSDMYGNNAKRNPYSVPMAVATSLVFYLYMDIWKIKMMNE